MIEIKKCSKYLPEAEILLNKSVDFIRSLYKEEENHSYDLSKIDEFFLVYFQNIVVGCGAYYYIGDFYIEMKHIYIESSMRGKGCGKKLIKYIEECAAEDGFENVVLETTLKQIEAINLYTSMGYEYAEPYREKLHDEHVFMKKEIK